MVLIRSDIARGELQLLGWRQIRAFVEQYKSLFSGRTLDFGCGRILQPQGHQRYRDLVTGEYCGYDPNIEGCKDFPSGTFDTILATSSLTYAPEPARTIAELRAITKPGGHWVISYNSNWYEFLVSSGEIWRFARAGMEQLVQGSEILFHDPLITIKMNGWVLNLTYGLVVRWP